MILRNISFASALLSYVLGTFVLLKGVRKPLNILWFLTCLSIGTWCIGFGLMISLTDYHQALFFTRWVEHMAAILIPVLFLHFVLMVLKLPTIRMVWVGYGISLILIVLNVANQFVTIKPLPPYTFYASALDYPAYWLFTAYFFVYVISAQWILMREMMHSEGRLRNQIKYIFWGTSVGFIGGGTTFFEVYDIHVNPVGASLVPLYTLTVFYSIFRHQLMDIRLVVQRALAYSAVSAILAAIYVGFVLAIVHFIQGDVRQASILPTIAAACGVSALFHPFSRRLQARIDQIFSRPERLREAKLAAFTANVIGQENIQHMTDSLCEVINDGLKPTTISLYLLDDQSKDFIQLSSDAEGSLPKTLAVDSSFGLYFTLYGDPILRDLPHEMPTASPEGASVIESVLAEMDHSHLRVAVPLRLRGALLGFFLLGPKKVGDLYAEEDLVLLKLIANQATLAYERPRLMKEITSGFVHEIKMPLSNIALPAELSFMDLEDLESGKKSLADVVPKIKARLKSIMSQAMLAGEKIETIRQVSDIDRLSKTFAEIGPIIDRSLAQTQPLLHKFAVALSVTVAHPQAQVRGSGKQIEIVLVNLIKNAVEAMSDMPVGQGELTITAQEEKEMVLLEIRDNGGGIPPAQLEAIFEPHFSTKGSLGSGIGLFLSRQIVKAHGGIIQVASGPKEGTCFSLRLPRFDAERAALAS